MKLGCLKIEDVEEGTGLGGFDVVRAVFTLGVESYCFTLLRYMIGLKKLMPLFIQSEETLT